MHVEEIFSLLSVTVIWKYDIPLPIIVQCCHITILLIVSMHESGHLLFCNQILTLTDLEL